MRTTSVFTTLAALTSLAATSAAQMTTSLANPPRIGAILNVEYAGTPGDGYAMFLSAPAATSLPVPGIGGFLLLDPLSIVLMYFGAVPGGGVDTVGVPVPNNPGLLGGTIEMQPLNIAVGPTFDFGVNDVQVTFGHVGRHVLFQGPSVSATVGSLDVQLSTNNTIGAPLTQGIGSFAVQIIQHYGQEGWVEGYAHAFGATPFYQDVNTYKRNRPARNMATGGALQSVVLNSTRDLMIVRNAANTREFALMTIDVTNGQAAILSGSVLQDNVATSVTPVVMYHSQVAVTDDGNLAALLVRDENNIAATSYNRVFLVKTDGTTWVSSGTAVLNVSIAVAAPVYFAQTLYFANGRLIAGGGNGWQSCPTDGSAVLVSIPLPNTGVGNPNAFIYSPAWRVSRDRQTVVLPIGGNTTNSAIQHDIVALTGISASGFTAVNVSGFPTEQSLQRFFGTGTYTFASSAASSVGKRVDLSPDGARVAFLGGTNLVADPTRLYVARTDGSDAGTLTAVTAGLFDPQVVYMCGVEFVTNNTVLFWAGTTHSSTLGNLDLYAYDVTLNTVTNLTQTTTGSTVAPFTQGGNTGNIIVHSTFKSENGNWLYFLRGDNRTTTVFEKNIVGVDVNTLALKDITGSEFSAGTAPAVYRGATTRTTDPWVAVETLLRKSPVGNMAYFADENAAGATAALFNDANIFGFDMENGGQAVQITNFTTAGGTTATVNYIQSMNISPDGQTIAFAMRTGTSTANSEDVFVISTSAVLGTPTQLSVTAAGGHTITDGSIHFTGTPVNAVVWSVGTGSTTVPTANTVAQWRPISAFGPVIDLSEPPVAAPAKAVLIHSANAIY